MGEGAQGKVLEIMKSCGLVSGASYSLAGLCARSSLSQKLALGKIASASIALVALARHLSASFFAAFMGFPDL